MRRTSWAPTALAQAVLPPRCNSHYYLCCISLKLASSPRATEKCVWGKKKDYSSAFCFVWGVSWKLHLTTIRMGGNTFILPCSWWSPALWSGTVQRMAWKWRFEMTRGKYICLIWLLTRNSQNRPRWDAASYFLQRSCYCNQRNTAVSNLKSAFPIMLRGAIPPVSNLYADSHRQLLQYNEMLKTVRKGKKEITDSLERRLISE